MINLVGIVRLTIVMVLTWAGPVVLEDSTWFDHFEMVIR